MRDDYSAPEPCNLARRQIEGIAENVAEQLGFTPGDNPGDAAGKLGGRIQYSHFSNLDESDSGSLLVHNESDFDIFLSTNTSITRDRFTIAHEIGHYVLHYLLSRQSRGGVPEKLIAMRYGSDRSEWEANWFAAAFLMPRDAFRTAYRKHEGRYSSVADAFGVSVSAAEVRAKVLGMEN